MSPGWSSVQSFHGRSKPCSTAQLANWARECRSSLHLEPVLVVARNTHDRPALARGLEGVAELLAVSEPERAIKLVGSAAAMSGGKTSRAKDQRSWERA